MNIWSWIVLAITAAVIVLAAIGTKKSGGKCSGCTGDCSSCAYRKNNGK